ncbi:MAG: hypothetical protein JRM85_01100 [Nitrososphaerota archaeon]|nr:hypothetical protein [Nitrososphaerota archaeon]
MGPCGEGDRLGVAREHRSLEDINRTKLKVQGRQVFVRVAIGTATKGLMAVYALCCRSSINTSLPEEGDGDMHQPARRPRERRARYPETRALDRYGLKWHHITFGERNAIEGVQDSV